MSDAFWVALFAAVPPTIVAYASLRASIRNGRELERHGSKMEQVVQKVKLRDDEIDLLKTGAFRQGHIAGQEYIKRISDFGKLSGK